MSTPSRALRVALTPASWLFRAAVAVRNSAYDAGLLAIHPLGLPTISVGNLTVGGTGKTPMASWFAQRISAAGGRPAILLRGYGGDEVLVHRRLTPQVIVEEGADRVSSAGRAREAGATVLVLDDAFQHRRVGRDADVVLVSADRHREARMLPAGPWREPLSALRRATHIVVTRRRVGPAHAREVLGFVGRVAPGAELVVASLGVGDLVRWDTGDETPAAAVAGQQILGISAVGDPASFEAQLRLLGARGPVRVFRDHHRFGPEETARLAADAAGARFVVCTLKDAVKLGPAWPATAPPLWYLSQRVSIEIGADALERLVRRLAKPAHN